MIRRIIIAAAAAGAALFAPAVAHAAPAEDPDGGLERLVWFSNLSPSLNGEFDPAAPQRPVQRPATDGTQNPTTQQQAATSPQAATPQQDTTSPQDTTPQSAQSRPAQRPAPQSGGRNPLEMLTGLLNGRGIMG